MALLNGIGGQECSRLESQVVKDKDSIKMISVSTCILPQQVSETKMTISLAQLPIGELILLTLIVAAISTITGILIVMVLSRLWFKRRLHQIKARIQTDSGLDHAGYGGSDEFDWQRAQYDDSYLDDFYSMPGTFRDDNGHVRPITKYVRKDMLDEIQTVPQVLSWDSMDVEMLRDADTFGSTGCVPGGVSFVGRTQTQIGSVTRGLNKRRSLFERVKHAVSR